MKKLFFKIFPPDRFDATSYFTMICGLVVIFAPFISCGPSKAELEARAKQGNIYSTPPPPNTSDEPCYNCNYEVTVIDSCEYVVYRGYNIIHKENCRNPIHNKNKTE